MVAAAPAKKAASRKAAGKAQQALPANPADVPAELVDFYGPPKLSRPRGAGTRGQAPDGVSLDFTSPTRDEIAEVPLEKLFSIDGRDFFIPVEFPPAFALIYLDGIEEGRDVALGRVLKAAMNANGQRGWDALQEFVKGGGRISRAQMAHLLDLVSTKIMGAMEDNGEGNG